jgi:hypothetical protein
MTSIGLKVNNIIEIEIEQLIKRISNDYKIDLEEMKVKYDLPFIKIDKPIVSTEKVKKQRGRKKKVNDEYISTTEYAYNGVTYLLDSKNNVYTYNIEEPKLIGEKLVDGTIKFTRSS